MVSDTNLQKIRVRHEFPGKGCQAPIFRKLVSDTVFLDAGGVAEAAVLERDALDQRVDALAHCEPELLECVTRDARAQVPAVDGQEQLDVDGPVEVDAQDLRLEHVAYAARVRLRGRDRDVARVDSEPELRADGR